MLVGLLHGCRSVSPYTAEMYAGWRHPTGMPGVQGLRARKNTPHVFNAVCGYAQKQRFPQERYKQVDVGADQTTTGIRLGQNARHGARIFTVHGLTIFPVIARDENAWRKST